MNLHIDIETYCELDLTKVGLYRYVEHPTFRIILFAYQWGNDPIEIVDLEANEQLPERILKALEDPAVFKWAHNAEFERVCLSCYFNIISPIEQWRCTMAWARSMSLPGSLDVLSSALSLPIPKMKEGKLLIKKFCVPQKRKMKALSNDDWALFKQYCIADVAAEVGIHEVLASYPWPEDEIELYHIDQKINQTGLPVDLDLVKASIKVADEYRDQVMTEAKESTGLDNPNSRNQMLELLQQQGAQIDDLRSKTVDDALKSDDVSSIIKETLSYRKKLSKSSIAKYQKLTEMVCEDGWFRGGFAYCGASRTGRWSAKGFQIQNLPRPSINLNDITVARQLIKFSDTALMRLLYRDVGGVLSSLIRSCIAAPDGYKIVGADFSSIEPVMGAWACESEYQLNLLRDGLDLYKDFATRLFKVPYDEVTKKQRTLCKPCVLGASYGLGGLGLLKYAEQFGVKLTADEAAHQVQIFREAYSEIPLLWKELMLCACKAIQNTNKIYQAKRFKFKYDGRFLMLRLPSGRIMYYHKPKVEPGKYGGFQIAYMGKTDKIVDRMHPAKIYENIIQAISRDALAYGLKNAIRKGHTVLGTVHDELIALAPAEDDTALDRLLKDMTVKPSWCPDAPIKADGYTGAFFRKG